MDGVKKILYKFFSKNKFVGIINSNFPLSDYFCQKVLVGKLKRVILSAQNDIASIHPRKIAIVHIDPQDKLSSLNLLKNSEKTTWLLNWDDMSVRKLRYELKEEIIFFGSEESCHIYAGNRKIEDLYSIFELNFGVERVKIHLKLLGNEVFYAALVAASLGILEGIPLLKIKKSLEEIEPIEHLLQVIPGPSDSTVLDDTFSHGLKDIEDAIDTMMQLPSRRRIVVLSAISNLGEETEKIHREIAQKLFREKVDIVLLGLNETYFIANELKELGFWEERLDENLQNQEIVSKLLKVLKKGDTCLIKGTKSSRFDEIIRRITKNK